MAEIDNNTGIDIRQQIRDTLAHLEHVLPGQAPIKDFVHHNTLHGYQHMTFPDALKAAHELTGAYGYESAERYRGYYQQGRITLDDLNAVISEQESPHRCFDIQLQLLHALILLQPVISFQRSGFVVYSGIMVGNPPALLPSILLCLSWGEYSVGGNFNSFFSNDFLKCLPVINIMKQKRILTVDVNKLKYSNCVSTNYHIFPYASDSDLLDIVKADSFKFLSFVFSNF